MIPARDNKHSINQKSFVVFCYLAVSENLRSINRIETKVIFLSSESKTKQKFAHFSEVWLRESFCRNFCLCK
jgi:hypothetical protein